MLLSPAFNTIAMIKGSEKPDEYVMLSAHFDSWDGSSGATHNGHRPSFEAVIHAVAGFFTDSLSANVVSWSFNDVPTGNPGGTDGADA